ncbi:hypothetical protein NUU61_003140 [Penicillium alfredii]|uniref:Uncharacterized protein n=1 Tax=Penicillium alfredii TaxID=1506179 RepID=A0A9W9KHN0_9EURO|nr:uncharacterized protein NUU61_003140 [Penicillium alfredii]KAJ5105793.1 hypothetical protein NUU61_003140 [Penicillium alfredii]
MITTHSFEGIEVAGGNAPARDSDGIEHEHSVPGPQDQPSQEASHPSSDPLGLLEALLVQRHQDAFVVPFQAQGVRRSGVDRALGDPGPYPAAGCLGGRETVAPSSLLSGKVTTRRETSRKILAATPRGRRPGGERRGARLGGCENSRF